MLNFYMLERLIETTIRDARIPGLALALVQGDEVIYARGFGVTSVEDAGLPVTPQTLFCIGSISKVLTGTAIMRLVEAGKLDLDCPIAEYLPWLTFSRPGAERQITLRMLLSHTSGLRTRNERSEPRLPREPAGLEAFIRRALPRFAFIAEPGTVFAYSGPGLSLAGYIAETIAGKYFPDLMQELVFDPLEMRRTTYDRPIAMTYPLALPHQLDPDGALKATHFYQTNTPGNPTGFAISTALDLANLAIMYLNRGRFGESQIVAPELIAQMHRPEADLLATPGRGYGLTFWLDPYKGLTRVNHGGAIMTFRGYFELVPERNTGLVLLANRWDMGSPTLDKLVDYTLDQLLDLPAQPPATHYAAPDPAAWPRCTGRYWSYLDGSAIVELVGDELTLDWNGWRAGLRSMGDDRYMIKDTNLTVGFATDSNGPATHLLIGLPAWSMTFTRADSAFRPNPATWQKYIGVYRLDDDLVDYEEKLTVRLVDDRLAFNIDTEGDEQMTGVPISDTAFATRQGLFEFQSAANGDVPTVRFADEFTYIAVDAIG
jgi:CubicO group peptidase (beta-lactamase class C family)